MLKAKPSTGPSRARCRIKWTRTDGTGLVRHVTVTGGADSALAKALRGLDRPLACASVEVWESGYTDEATPLIRLTYPCYAKALAELPAALGGAAS